MSVSEKTLPLAAHYQVYTGKGRGIRFRSPDCRVLWRTPLIPWTGYENLDRHFYRQITAVDKLFRTRCFGERGPVAVADVNQAKGRLLPPLS